ncbi:hypothetical protein CRG98_020272 [Punica granatum]|uniref:Uncharacterized protein n=1 Tax=Punica granatum TaxID=22663 RepID=A0A2I0JSV1_PUNGR|nr:hypothetical protein CRG98_020272 [Punica granatum]
MGETKTRCGISQHATVAEALNCTVRDQRVFGNIEAVIAVAVDRHTGRPIVQEGLLSLAPGLPSEGKDRKVPWGKLERNVVLHCQEVPSAERVWNLIGNTIRSRLLDVPNSQRKITGRTSEKKSCSRRSCSLSNGYVSYIEMPSSDFRIEELGLKLAGLARICSAVENGRLSTSMGFSLLRSLAFIDEVEEIASSNFDLATPTP